MQHTRVVDDRFVAKRDVTIGPWCLEVEALIEIRVPVGSDRTGVIGRGVTRRRLAVGEDLQGRTLTWVAGIGAAVDAVRVVLGRGCDLLTGLIVRCAGCHPRVQFGDLVGLEHRVRCWGHGPHLVLYPVEDHHVVGPPVAL